MLEQALMSIHFQKIIFVFFTELQVKHCYIKSSLVPGIKNRPLLRKKVLAVLQKDADCS